MYHNLSSAYLFIFLGDHKQLPPTVPSLHVKLVADDKTSPPFIIFATQLNTSFMTRQLHSGMGNSMFKEQFGITSGIQEFPSRPVEALLKEENSGEHGPALTLGVSVSRLRPFSSRGGRNSTCFYPFCRRTPRVLVECPHLL